MYIATRFTLYTVKRLAAHLALHLAVLWSKRVINTAFRVYPAIAPLNPRLEARLNAFEPGFKVGSRGCQGKGSA